MKRDLRVLLDQKENVDLSVFLVKREISEKLAEAEAAAQDTPEEQQVVQ